MPTHARRRVHPHTTLDADEQDELATKLRFGVGLDELVGERAASVLRRHLPRPRRDQRTEHLIPAPREQLPDDEVRARAAALGVTAGRRGQWLRR